MVSPTIGRPWRCSKPATTELSTPPDMATAMVFSDTGGISRRQLSQLRNRFGDGRDQGGQRPAGRVDRPLRRPGADQRNRDRDSGFSRSCRFCHCLRLRRPQRHVSDRARGHSGRTAIPDGDYRRRAHLHGADRRRHRSAERDHRRCSAGDQRDSGDADGQWA